MPAPEPNDFPASSTLDCSYCGNRTPHTLAYHYEHRMLFDQMEFGDNNELHTFNEPYTWLCYACGTCGGLNLYGGFFGIEAKVGELGRSKLHPLGSNIVPPPHMLEPSKPVPAKVLRLYEEVWPLRHRSPTAFIVQVRRLMEFICAQQGAQGKTLVAQLNDLRKKGVFPGYFSQITDLLRTVGNLGAHAGDTDLSIWEAELIDDFFRSVLEYVYIAPAKIRRMETRMRSHKKRPGAVGQ